MWPALSQTILVTLMFVGACAGSTGGGMKVSRLVILFKTIRKELSLIIHPREIRKIRMDGHVVEHSTLRSTNVFLVIYFILLMLSTLIISLDEFDFTTNFTAVVSCLNNIGPGFKPCRTGAEFFDLLAASQGCADFDMLAGRLELFPLMILFMPSTWRKITCSRQFGLRSFEPVDIFYRFLLALWAFSCPDAVSASVNACAAPWRRLFSARRQTFLLFLALSAGLWYIFVIVLN